MKKIVAMLLTLTMALGCLSGLAENTKHERVYVVTGADGSVQSITDNIRLENADASDVLLDRTLLTDIQNLSGQETFTLSGEELTWQANGKDITYQGTSDKTPAVLPRVTLTLDGAEISAADLKEKTGEVTLCVNYQVSEQLPALVVSLLLLPEEGVTDLKLENATVLSEMGRQILVGWAAPGLDQDLDLPDSFSATFQADHAELNWMMTISTSDPIDAVCKEIEDRVELDAHLELDEAEKLLTALQKGETLPETTGKTKDIAPKINELNDGLTQLDDGAKELADGTVTLADGAADLKDGAKELDDGVASLVDGAKELKDGAKELDDGAGTLADALTQLSEGAASVDTGAGTLADALTQISDGAASLQDGSDQLATGAQSLATGIAVVNKGSATLEEGLTTLIENNDTLNAGATAIFSAILATANQQIAASGLDAAGITLPELTAENYEAALTAVLDQLNPDTLKEAAAVQVEAVVRPQVEANRDQVQQAVEAAVEAKVLEAVLQAVGQDLTAEQYAQAVKAGQIPEETAQQISGAVAQQMASDEVKTQVEEAVQAQIDQLVQENVENYLSTDETVAAQLASAQAGYNTLSSLKDQLDQISAFVAGVQAYTDGAKQAADGAAQLHTGLTTINEGAATLRDGTKSLKDGADALADGASQAADGAATLKDGTAQLADGAKQAADGAATLKDGTAQLADGTVTLHEGTETLKDGSAQLADGAEQLADGAVELKDGAATLREDGTKNLKDTLLDAEKEAAEKLLPYVQDDLSKALRIYEETRDNAKNAGYDLRPEDMKTVTVYIIRTDLE